MNSNAQFAQRLMGSIETSMQMVIFQLQIVANAMCQRSAFSASPALLSKVLDGVKMLKLSTTIIHRLCATPKSTLNVAMYLRGSVRSMLVGEPLWRIARKRCLVLLAGLCLAIATPAQATKDATKKPSIDSLKLYAHSRIIDWKEMKCFDILITKESNWRVEAINPNGNHFGLGQMRNTKYRNLDGFRMIDWTLRYIDHRYSGQICNGALAHWRKHGWH